MHCANPKCVRDAPCLRDGSLHLLELEAAANRLPEKDECGFPMRSLPQRYFWLCGECTKVFSIARWTALGVVLALRKQYISTIDPVSPPIVGPLSAVRGLGQPLFQSAHWRSPQQ